VTIIRLIVQNCDSLFPLPYSTYYDQVFTDATLACGVWNDSSRIESNRENALGEALLWSGDAGNWKSGSHRGIWVQVPPPAPDGELCCGFACPWKGNNILMPA
jgi:hypothetical protein